MYLQATASAVDILESRLSMTVALILEALAGLECFLQALCSIWDALGLPGQPKYAIWDSCAGGSTDSKARGRWGGARGLTSCGPLWRAVAACGGLVLPL